MTNKDIFLLVYAGHLSICLSLLNLIVSGCLIYLLVNFTLFEKLNAGGAKKQANKSTP